ncbi:hypothetical protein HY493_01680 [Candidatus Woesearchaeota archaeon]|nr:hypothetical protein [Candidatus Woesearchaeota archaeon]
MAKIPAIVWLGIGAGVSYLSLRVGGNFTFFFYFGLVFIGIGVARILLSFVFRKKESRLEKRVIPRELPKYFLCPKCRAQVHAGTNFCWKCGRRLR